MGATCFKVNNATWFDVGRAYCLLRREIFRLAEPVLSERSESNGLASNDITKNRHSERSGVEESD
jgi:hypothetical protein